MSRCWFLTALLLCSAVSPHSLAAAPASVDAKLVWANHCANCHGSLGKAPARYSRQGVPDLQDPDWQSARTNKEIRKVITEGSKGTRMEPFKDKLSAAEIDALVLHVRRLKLKP